MSENQDHVRQSIDGQSFEPSADDSLDAMRWSPVHVSEPMPDSAAQTAADSAHALIDRATDAYVSLVADVLGDGRHHLVASAATSQGELIEGQELTVLGETVILSSDNALDVAIVIASAMVGTSTGGLVVRTFAPDGSEFVRGWRVRGFWLRPLTAQDIREAYTVDAETGAPLAPEPGLEYRQAERVPRPEAEGSSPGTGRTAPPDNRPPNRRN